MTQLSSNIRGAYDVHKIKWSSRLSCSITTTMTDTKPLPIESTLNRDVLIELMVYEMLLLQWNSKRRYDISIDISLY